MPDSPLHIAIVGGGIGGLFAANALLHHGLSVAVYEQAPALGEIGAGVYITPNGMRQLVRVGLGPLVEHFGSLIGPQSRYLRDDGREIAPVQVADANGWNATYGMHRADMIELLSAKLPKDIIHCGHRAVSFEQDATKGRVTFANGSTIEADAVIACDGIHSELRPYVFPPSKPISHGTISYRGLVPAERLPDWPMDRWLTWAGPAKHFLVFPVRHGAMVNYVGFVPTDEEMKESWSAPGNPEVLRAEFKGWDPRIEKVLAEVDTCFRWALYDREPLPVWTKGRLTLLGDSAHPMLPHLGQGANQSIEDGMALATILAKVSPNQVPQALLAYEKLRRARVADVQLGARQNGLRLYSMSEYTDLAKRDAELVAHQEFRKHLYAFDVVPEAEKAAVAVAVV